MERPYRRNLAGVLHNVLGSFVSRYSTFDGYWLFGFLVEPGRVLEIDLLVPAQSVATDPVGVARLRVRMLFRSQLAFGRVVPNEVASATLTITTGSNEVEVNVNGQTVIGFPMDVALSATDTAKRVFNATARIEVARHNSAVERRAERTN